MSPEHFRIVRELGDGAYGKCLLAKRNKNVDDWKSGSVVLKQMERKNRKVFENECRILFTLRHPFIVRFRGQFEIENHFVLVMEYAAGGSLSRLIKEEGGIRPEYVFIYFIQLTLALHYLHARKILHRDVKPDNIFLNWSRTCVLLGDFGSAINYEEATEEALTGTRGTWEYSSPEVLSGISAATDKDDMWPLGCVLYEMLTGKPAFEYGCTFQCIENCEYAPMSEDIDVVGRFLVGKLLIDHNVRWSTKDVLEYTNLHGLRIKILSRHWKLYQLEENFGHGFTPLHLACINGQLDTVKRMHDQDFDLESGDCFGFTPLMCATAEGQLEVMDYLLHARTDPARENFFGVDAITIALLNDQMQAMLLLERHGQEASSARARRESLLLVAPRVLQLRNEIRVKFEQSSASPIGEYCWPSVGKIYTAMIFSV